MEKQTLSVIKDMIKEYELLAKYNGGKDYERYSALLDVYKELSKKGSWYDTSL